MGIFPEGEDSRGDHGLGRLVGFRFKGPPGTTSSYITTHIIGTAPHGHPNLRSRLRFCHAQEERPRSPQGHVDLKKKVSVNSTVCLYDNLMHHTTSMNVINFKFKLSHSCETEWSLNKYFFSMYIIQQLYYTVTYLFLRLKQQI